MITDLGVGKWRARLIDRLYEVRCDPQWGDQLFAYGVPSHLLRLGSEAPRGTPGSLLSRLGWKLPQRRRESFLGARATTYLKLGMLAYQLFRARESL